MNLSLYKKDINGNLLEGPLSKKGPRLLIVLKEPHGESHNCFWVKDKVLKSMKGTKKYFNVLGAFARRILNISSKKEALENCAYINLYPENGGARAAGGGFERMIKHWKKGSDPEMKTLLNNRIEIIEDALDSGISIMTLPIIAELLQRDLKLSQIDNYADNKIYRCYNYKGGIAKVYCICHPASPRINYTTLGNELGFGKSIGEIN